MTEQRRDYVLVEKIPPELVGAPQVVSYDDTHSVLWAVEDLFPERKFHERMTKLADEYKAGGTVANLETLGPTAALVEEAIQELTEYFSELFQQELTPVQTLKVVRKLRAAAEKAANEKKEQST